MKHYRVLQVDKNYTIVYCYCGNKKELPEAVNACYSDIEKMEARDPYEHFENDLVEVQVQKYNKNTEEWEDFDDY